MSGQRVGYRRVSTLIQTTDRQLDGIALDEVFEDKLSGKDTDRPALDAMMRHLRKGDTLVVHSMDRLARNQRDLLAIVDELTTRGVVVEFVKESLTFSTDDNPLSRLMLQVAGAFAEFERAMIKERQREGIALAKERGAYRGRKKLLSDEQVTDLRHRAASGEPKSAIARHFGISRETVYQYLKD